MKKLGILFLVFLALSGVAYYLFLKNQKNPNNLETADRGFAVQSMEEIDKIVIKHKKLQPLIFTRKANGWELNGKYEVDPAVFVNVEKVLTNIKMLYIPPKNATQTIKNSISENGIQVDLYNGGHKPFKIFFVGTDTQKGDGTHMLMAGANQPYVMHLPGLAGGLRSRFEQPEKNFRDKYLFKDKLDDIVSIAVEYPKNQRSSFKIEQTNGDFTVVPTAAPHSVPQTGVNTQKLNAYLTQFASLGAEALINDFPEKDSLIDRLPSCIIEFNSKTRGIKRHKYYGYDEFVEKNGNARTPVEIKGQNRMFVWVDEKDLFVVQNRVYGGIFAGFDDFYTNPSDLKKIFK